MSCDLCRATAPDGPSAWENRRGLLLETIRRFDPDWPGMQEGLEEQAAFPRDSRSAVGFVGAGRDDGKLAGEMCARFFRADRLRRLDEGDGNAPASTERAGTYRALAGCAPRGAPALVDAYRVRHAPGRDEGTHHAFTGRTDGDRIVGILLSGDLVRQEGEIVRASDGGRYPSDHFPVTAVARVWAQRPACGRDGPADANAPLSPRFPQEIARFERENAELARTHVSDRPGELVLFVGSSSNRLWESLQRDVPGLCAPARVLPRRRPPSGPVGSPSLEGPPGADPAGNEVGAGPRRSRGLERLTARTTRPPARSVRGRSGTGIR